MVNLLTGPKGSGKTQQMIELANKKAKECNGNVVFIKKTHRDTASVAFDIRTICMDDFTSITNTDEYIGFLYGMYSSNHDVECIFIDGILNATFGVLYRRLYSVNCVLRGINRVVDSRLTFVNLAGYLIEFHSVLRN